MDVALSFAGKHALQGRSNLCILPRSEQDTKSKPIKTKRDFPTETIGWRNTYAKLENRYAFSPMPSDRNGRTIKGTMRFGGNMDVEEILEDISFDLWEDHKVSWRKKELQILNTVMD